MSAGNERAGRPSHMARVDSSLNDLITEQTITPSVIALQATTIMGGTRQS